MDIYRSSWLAFVDFLETMEMFTTDLSTWTPSGTIGSEPIYRRVLL